MDADRDTTATTKPDLSPEVQAMLADLMKQVDEGLTRENEARAEAAKNGTISPYDVAVNQRGHRFTRQTVVRRDRLDEMLAQSGEAVVTQVHDRFFPDEVRTVADTAHLFMPECHVCGQSLTLAYDGENVYPTTDCEFPDGYTIEVSITVTSGKIVIDDYINEYIPVDDGTDSANGTFGQSKIMKQMEAEGCAHGFVGNSCPALFQTGENTYTIASYGYDYDANEPVAPEGTELAGIITDSWTYTIADYDAWIAKGGNPDTPHGPEVVEVPNGVYAFTHLTGLASFDRDSSDPVVYATITRTDDLPN